MAVEYIECSQMLLLPHAPTCCTAVLWRIRGIQKLRKGCTIAGLHLVEAKQKAYNWLWQHHRSPQPTAHGGEGAISIFIVDHAWVGWSGRATGSGSRLGW